MTSQNSRGPAREKTSFSRASDRTDVPETPELEAVQRWLLRYDVECLHGPEEIDYETDELVVLCLLRNGRPYLKSFVEHYRSLGARHLVFLDNGSTDGTVEALKHYDNVTVLSSGLSFKRYQLLMRKYLIERFGRGRWTLSVDIDELFDYPYSDVVGLDSFLRYLNERSYNAVVSYMLDMFPEEPLAEVEENGELPIKETHRFYDLSHVTAHEYPEPNGAGNVLSNKEIAILQHGVQKRIFNLNPILSKHPLVFLDGELEPVDMSEHWAGNARVADLSGVLYHYKLTGALYNLVRREIEERRYVNKWGKYDKYLRVLESNPSLLIKDENSRELESVNDLVGNGFLAVSVDYMEFVQQKNPSKLVEAFFRARVEAEPNKREVQPARAGGQASGGLQTELEQKEAQISHLKSQLDGVLASKSWRMLDRINRMRRGLKGK